MNSVNQPQLQRISFFEVVKSFGILIVIGTLIYLIVIAARAIENAYNYNKANVSTPENNARIRKEQIELFEGMFVNQGRRPAAVMSREGLKTDKLTIPALGAEQNALINFSVLTCNNAGYMGPMENGVFAEEDAIRIAYGAGCRAFVLHIDYMDDVPEFPQLVVRNATGDKICNNTGSISKTIRAIANGAPRGAAADPIIIILFVHRLPTKNAYDPKCVNFMKKIAIGLEALRDRHLGLTSEGDYRRQGQQDSLFIRPRSSFDGKFIIMTNIDTKAFRDTKNNPGIKPLEDLDLWVHARLVRDTSSNLNLVDTASQTKDVQPIIETYNYFSSIPDGDVTKLVARSKVQWTIVMNNYNDKIPKYDTLKKLLDEYGASCVPVDIFTKDYKEAMDSFFVKEMYRVSGYRPKVEAMRYNKPAPEPLKKPNPQLDANDGMVGIPQG